MTDTKELPPAGRFTKKPVTIEAVQVAQRMDTLNPDWFADAVTANTVILHGTGKWGEGPCYLEIKTLEGVMRAEVGDWIIQGVKGELYPCKPDIFAATYEPAALASSREAAQPVAWIVECRVDGVWVAQFPAYNAKRQANEHLAMFSGTPPEDKRVSPLFLSAPSTGREEPSERTPQDYAIEHAEYMANDAERLLEAVNDLAKAEQEFDDGQANQSDVDAARETVTEAQRSLRNGIHEFRKRRERALSTPAVQAVPVGADETFRGYLCEAWGETDLPCVEVARDVAGVRAFIVREWLNGPEDDSRAQEVIDEITAHDFKAEGAWQAEFEIGGISVAEVFASPTPSVGPVPVGIPGLFITRRYVWRKALEGIADTKMLNEYDEAFDRLWAIMEASRSSVGSAAPKEAEQQRRGCTNEDCGWEGFTDRMCGSIGPLCPRCDDTTEVLRSAPATGSPSRGEDGGRVRTLAEGLLDIWDDGSNPPEHRVYVPEALREGFEELRAALATPAAPAGAPSPDAGLREALTDAHALLSKWPGGVPDSDYHIVTRIAALAAAPSVGGVAASPLTGKYGEVLRPFLTLMERELHANSRKGDRPGWLKMDANTALLEVYWHAAKLSAAVKNNDGPAIQEHSADVANMAMMVLDVCGGLVTVEASPPSKFVPRMDIYSRPGTMVVFDAGGGYPYEQERAKKVLEVGKTYAVARVEVQSARSSVMLVGIEGRFNTVMFAATPAGGDKQ